MLAEPVESAWADVDPIPMNSSVEAALRWLLDSGIQQPNGGVARYYRADSRAYRDVSTELTGYFLGAVIRPGRGSALPEQALRAGRFLIEQGFDRQSELFPFEIPGPGDSKPRLAYFFDCGIIIRGLVKLWESTNESAFLDAAERCGLALAGRMRRVDGAFFPLLNLDTGEPFEGADQWSLRSGVYHLKVGLAFRELSVITGLAEFDSCLGDLKRWCLACHEAFLPGHDDPERVMDRMHAYGYFLEGLLPFAGLEADSSRALQFGILKLENLVAEIGPGFLRSDVVAQLLRLRLFAEKLGVMELDYRQAEEEAAVVRGFQQEPADPAIQGGFAFARRGGETVPHINPASTIFALQALDMWDQTKDGCLTTTWRELV
jgi:hypothetical protein